MASYIHLIRHGITDGLLNRWFYGWTDLPVVEKGFEELEEYKKAGIYPKFDLSDCNFYTSGMLRANQTLKTIYGNVPFKGVEKLKEINFGDWELKTYEELEGQGGWDAWMNDTTGTFTFPGSEESMVSFTKRILEGYREVEKEHRLKEFSHRHSGKDAVSCIVCHGGTIAATMLSLFPEDKNYFFEWTPHTGRGYTIIYENGDPVRWIEI